MGSQWGGIQCGEHPGDMSTGWFNPGKSPIYFDDFPIKKKAAVATNRMPSHLNNPSFGQETAWQSRELLRTCWVVCINNIYIYNIPIYFLDRIWYSSLYKFILHVDWKPIVTSCDCCLIGIPSSWMIPQLDNSTFSEGSGELLNDKPTIQIVKKKL